MHVRDFIKNGRLVIIAKPNASRTELLSYDPLRDAVKIAIAAPPDDNKANEALLKYLKKVLCRECELVSGATSRKKVVKFS